MQLIRGGLDDKLLEILSQGLKQRENRQNWMSLWQELRDIFHPDATSFTSDEIDGEEKRTSVYSSVPELARRGLSTAMSNMLRPSAQRWFKAKPKNAQLEANELVRGWLDVVTQITYAALYDPRANMEKVLFESDSDLVTFGTAVVAMRWDSKGRHFVFRPEQLRNVVLLQDKYGQIDAAWTFKQMTIRQLVQMFGKDKLSEKIKDKLAQNKPNYDEKYEVCHVCFPNEDFEIAGFKPGNFPYASLWFEVEPKHLIDKAGYWEFPYLTPRWDTMSGEVYGRSPAMTALNDSRALLKMEQTFLDAGAMAVRPPLGAWADLIRGDIQLMDGGLTMFDHHGYNQSGPPIWPIQTGQLPREVLEYMAAKEDRIYKCFFRHILELPTSDGEKMTAYEAAQRVREYQQQAAPVFARVADAYNPPLVNRAFNTLMREGMYPEPPPEMYGQEVEFEYEGPLKTARDKAEAMKIVEGVTTIQQLAAGLPPEKAMELMDNIDVDVMVRLLGQKGDLPQIMFRPLEQVMEERAARAKQMQMAQMAEMANKVAPMIGSAGRFVTDAKQTGMISTDDPLPIPAAEMDPSELLDDADYSEALA